MEQKSNNVFSRLKEYLAKRFPWLFSKASVFYDGTIEEKSFWVVSPLTVIFGLVSLSTSVNYSSPWPTLISVIFCVAIPAFLMVLVLIKKNYNIAYPLLCISTGAITLPFVFAFTGGFLSGSLLVSVVTTGLTVLCYKPFYRFTSFALCLAGNTIAFTYVYFNGSPFPLSGSESLFYAENLRVVQPVYDDMILGYFMGAIAFFASVSFVIGDIRRYRLNQEALQQYFDKEKRNEILRNVLENGKGVTSEMKKATIVFADISNFTTITENMSREDVAKYLNEFFTRAEKHIHGTGGIIDKFIGDCVMAYWLDKGDGNCVYNAVSSLIDLKNELIRDSEKLYDTYNTELDFSAGIAYGDVVFGDIGSHEMHDFTVIGDAVNTASRIQNYAVCGEFLLSESAAKQIGNRMIFETVESDHFFKGKNRPVDIYRVLGIAQDNHNAPIPERADYGYVLKICGCRGSFPVSGLRFTEYGGETSCYTMRKGDYALVVDCGTGLKNAVKFLDGCKQIDILLTHVHYDHILGFLMSKFPSGAKIRMFGSFSTWGNGTESLDSFMKHPYWPVDIMNTAATDVELEHEYRLNDDLTATFYASDHPDDGRVITVCCHEKKVVFLFDCERAEKLPDKISADSDLLFFDGMFDDNDTVDHRGWGHGTWQGGVRFGEGRNIKKLVITHHNPELGDHTLKLREEAARETNQNISFAKTGDVFVI